MSTTAPEESVMVTGRGYAARPTSDDVAASAPVLAAVWCRSVGSSWTLELHQLGRGTALGTVTDWISSGVPISQPEPEALARTLLAERRLHLFRDSSAGPGTHNRHCIGYVCKNAELIRLAHLVRDDATGSGLHPVVLAARWIEAGFSADDAAGWILLGVSSPQQAQQRMCSGPPRPGEISGSASPGRTSRGHC
ncbi:MAG: hypothetical protein ACRDTH_08145 [Pseudonocardiaceae bacterium]